MTFSSIVDLSGSGTAVLGERGGDGSSALGPAEGRRAERINEELGYEFRYKFRGRAQLLVILGFFLAALSPRRGNAVVGGFWGSINGTR
jgi:hypothetical protein